MSHFDEIQVDSQVGVQEPFREPRDLAREYSVMEEDSLEENTYLAYNISMGNSLDRKLYIAIDVLDYVLCSAPGAPIKQALIDKGIGKDVYSTVENDIYQPYFSITAKEAEGAQKEEFVSTIEQVLKDAVAKGLDRRAIAAAINHFEFKYREADFGSFPKGQIGRAHV